MENSEIIKKADLALSDLTSNGGLLSPTQTNTFMRTLIDEPTLLNSMRTKIMSAPIDKINKIGFGSRILRPAVSNVALSEADRAKADLGQVILETKEVMATIYLPYSVLEDNIEGGNVGVGAFSSPGGLHNTLVTLMAQRAALDLEELAIMGDTTSADPYLALQNGFLKKTTANVVNVGAAFDKNAVKAALKAMPTKYLRDRTSLQHFVSVGSETEIRDSYSNRQTGLGDSSLQGNQGVSVFGSAVKGVALMPGANGLFTNPQNLIFGIWRNVMMEYDKNIETRQFIIVLTMRMCFEIEEQNAIAKYTGIVGG